MGNRPYKSKKRTMSNFHIVSYLVFDEFTKTLPQHFPQELKHYVLRLLIENLVLADSEIVTEPKYLHALSSWFPNKFFILLYRGSRDGFMCKNFHSRCDGKGETLVVIKTRKGNIFGGWTPINRGLERDETTMYDKTDQETFIFTLKNPHGIEPTRYPKDPRHGRSIYDSPHDGPTFGSGSDIRLQEPFNEFDSSYHPGESGSTSPKLHLYTNFPNSFVDTTKRGKETFDGNPHDYGKFFLEDIEVFGIRVV